MNAALPVLDGSVDLDQSVLDQFTTEGHTAIRGLATPEEVSTYRPSIEAAAQRHNLESRAIEDRDSYGKAFLQTTNLWREDEAVRRFVFSSRFASVAARLMDCTGVRLYHDQALFKEPGGGPTPWHQDQFYWPFTDGRTITMWMPLVDVGNVPGSMTFAAGSHHLGAVSEQPISDESQAEVEEIIDRHGLARVSHGALAAGDATFHAGWTLHSAGGNPTGTMRSVMTVIYVADGIEVSEPANPFQDFDRQMWLGGRQPGQPVDGELNPVLFLHRA